MRDKLLTHRQAAEMLGISVGTLYNWVNERRIAYVKLGRNLRYRESVLLKYIGERDQPAIS